VAGSAISQNLSSTMPSFRDSVQKRYSDNQAQLNHDKEVIAQRAKQVGDAARQQPREVLYLPL